MAMRAGIIGCGVISAAYLRNGATFSSVKIVAGSDILPEASRRCSEEFGIRDMTVKEMLADPDIDIILNLTTPQAHVEVNLQALAAGKHVYCEKPFGLDRQGALEVIKLAETKGLRVGCAPDTFLGGGHQNCRQVLDSGLIGKVISGTAFMMCHGHESWHTAPAFYYLKGGGPLFDMGPYYLTALIQMLGPIKKVTAFSTRSTDLREGLKVNVGKTFPVEIDTHISAVLAFHSGAVITLITSFDVWKHSGYRDIELHGTEGSMHVPDPNTFAGDARFFKAGLSADWAPLDNPFIYNENMRSIGLADMAQAIATKRPHRCSGELAFHVLDVMCAICESAASDQAVTIQSTCSRPAPLPIGLSKGQLD